MVSIIVSLITSFITILVFAFQNNNGIMNRAIAFTSAVGETLMIPLNKTLVGLIATKMAHDEKYILGRCKSVDETLV